MPAAFAAAASASTFAPGSLASRKLMIDAKPIFLISGTASGLMAPEHATVVSMRARLVTPGIVSLVTCWAPAGEAAIHTATIKPAAIRKYDLTVSLLQRE